jgi:hypothetical protein
MTVSWTKERDKKVMIEEGETAWTMERKRDKNFFIISDRSLPYTVFYPTNSAIGNKESSAIYVRFHVSIP